MKVCTVIFVLEVLNINLFVLMKTDIKNDKSINCH